MTNKIRQTLKKSEIIRNKDEISLLFNKGKRIHLAGVTLYLLPANQTRACFIIKKDVGNAVIRNRYKRWLREIFRKHKDWFLGHDVMFYLSKKQLVNNPGYHFYRNSIESHFSKKTK